MYQLLCLTLTPRDALLYIYNTNGGAYWVGATHWATTASICVWEGITCNFNGLVEGIDLKGFGLTGSLANVFDSFPQLKALRLSDNFLVSAFPATFCKLVSLQNLEANNAGFMGEIPTCFCDLESLQYLSATFNALSGELPACMAQLVNLHGVALSCNDFSGTVPAGMQLLNYLTLFSIDCNENFVCTSPLSDKVGLIYFCGMEDCDDCTVPIGNCPTEITLPDCGVYAPLLPY